MEIPKKYQKIIDRYPKFVSKDEMCRICKISKKTALYLFENGFVPVAESEKCTHKYRVAVVDIVAYLMDKVKNPEKYRMAIPKKEPVVVKRPSIQYIQALKAYMLTAFESAADVLTSIETAELTGYTKVTVHKWVQRNWLQAFHIGRGYKIPKQCLIDFLASHKYLGSPNKSPFMEQLIGGFQYEQM